jgi:hypothetical protein
MRHVARARSRQPLMQNAGGSEDGMPSEIQFLLDGEDARDGLMRILRGNEEDGLKLAHLLGDPLHLRRAQTHAFRENDQPVAGERRPREDIHVAKGAHAAHFPASSR